MKKEIVDMKKWLKITIITVSAVFLLLAIVLLLVSPIAKGYVNKHGKDLIGREVNVEKLRVNVLGGRVRVCDLTVYEEDGSTVFFGIDTLDVSVKLRKLLSHELYVRHITLAEPRVRIIQDGNRFNFSSIVDRFATDEEDTTSSDWRLGFYNIRLSEGQVYYCDSKLGSEWDLKNLNLRIPGVYFDGSENTDAGLALQLADGGVLRTEASMNMDNNEFHVDVALENFAVSNVRAYLSDVMNVGKLDGVLNADIRIDGNLSELLKMNIVGNVGVSDADISDIKGERVLAFSDLSVDVRRINLDENFFDVNSVKLSGLTTHFDMYKNGNNFSRFFDVKKDEKETDGKETAEEAEIRQDAKPLKFKVGRLSLNDARLTYNDYSLPEAFTYVVNKLNVSAENFTSEGENNAKIFAQLQHGGVAAVSWRGVVDNWKWSQYLILNIKNIQLKDLSPYSVAYLGYPFVDGTFSFSSENSIRGGMLEGSNRIDLYNPEVGDKRKDVEAELNIPLKAALYLLKDKDGKVQLDVPVKGDIDSPEFSYMKTVWKTLGNLVVKVATSPFRAAAKALGQSGELDFIAFDPLQSQFDSEQYSVLNKIVEVLQYDTNVVVTLEPQVDMSTAAKAQSVYLLKEEYYLSIHPEKSNSDVLPQVFLYKDVNILSVKDTGFVRFLRAKGFTGRQVTDKALQRLAEQYYPLDAAKESLVILGGHRDAYVRRFFAEQGISPRRLVIAPLNTEAQRSGYSINSTVEEEKRVES